MISQLKIFLSIIFLLTIQSKIVADEFPGRVSSLTANGMIETVNYNLQLLPGQNFTGYFYYWTNGDTLSAFLTMNPVVSWLSINPQAFTSTSCSSIVPVAFSFTAPANPGVYTTTIVDQNNNWVSINVTLNVTITPTVVATDTIKISPGSNATKFETLTGSGLTGIGCLPVYFPATTANVQFAASGNPGWINFNPQNFTLSTSNPSVQVTKNFQWDTAGVYNTYEILTIQWYSYPRFVLFNLEVTEQKPPTNLIYNQFIHTLNWVHPDAEFLNYVISRKEKFATSAQWNLVESDSGGTISSSESEWVIRTNGYYYYKVGAVYESGDTLYSDSVNVARGYFLRKIQNDLVEAYNVYKSNYRLIPNQRQYMWPSNWWLRFDYQNPSLFDQTYFSDVGPSIFPDWYLASEIRGYDRSYIYYPDRVNPDFVNVWKNRRESDRDWSGSCLGFAIAAIFDFNNFAPYKQRFSFFTGQIPAEVAMTNNAFGDSVRRMINYFMETQSFGRVTYAHQTINRTPNEVLQLLYNDFSNYQNNFYKFIDIKGNKKSYNHALLPYAIEKFSNNITYIYVYDSNAPANDTRRIEINTSNNTWRMPGYINTFSNHFISVRGGIENLFNTSMINKEGSEQLDKFDVLMAGSTSSVVMQNGDTLVAFNYADTSYSSIDYIIAYPTDGILRAPDGYELEVGDYTIIFSDYDSSNGNPGIYLKNDINGSSGFKRKSADDPDESDLVVFGINKMIYVNPDNKHKNIYLYQVIDNSENLSNKNVKYFEARNYIINTGDSVSVSKTTDEDILLINFGQTTSLDLLLTYSDTLKSLTFKYDQAIIPANSGLTIKPVWENLQNSLLTIFIDIGNNGTIDDTLTLVNQVTGIQNDQGSLMAPDTYNLAQNYPNPFNPSTKISWQLPVGSHQSIKVYDVLGNEVATLVDEYREAGRYEVEFNGSNLASGMYLYRLQAGSFVETKKMILIK